MVSDTVVTAPDAASTESDLNATLEIRPPQPSYDPHSHTGGSRTIAQAQHESTEISGQTVAAEIEPEQEVGLHRGDHHIEEDIDIAVGNAKREVTVDSAENRDIRGPITQTPEDAVGPSLDA